jgi:hypothetical protein
LFRRAFWIRDGINTGTYLTIPSRSGRRIHPQHRGQGHNSACQKKYGKSEDSKGRKGDGAELTASRNTWRQVLSSRTRSGDTQVIKITQNPTAPSLMCTSWDTLPLSVEPWRGLVEDRNLKICVGSICGKGSNQGHDLKSSRLLIPQSVNIVETAGALTVLSRETKDVGL